MKVIILLTFLACVQSAQSVNCDLLLDECKELLESSRSHNVDTIFTGKVVQLFPARLRHSNRSRLCLENRCFEGQQRLTAIVKIKRGILGGENLTRNEFVLLDGYFDTKLNVKIQIFLAAKVGKGHYRLLHGPFTAKKANLAEKILNQIESMKSSGNGAVSFQFESPEIQGEH